MPCKILGIESSCDETAVAVVADGREVIAERLASQVPIHAPFGGVVPEIASRRHLETLFDLIAEVSGEVGGPDSLDAIAVTHKPGLIGALLVGVSAAKGLALGWGKPLVGVDHVHAHAYSTVMSVDEPAYPIATLVVSGGHTSLYWMRSVLELELVGQTVDDAAGEAFDKVSSLLGLGYPGGPAIQQAARGGRPTAHRFPRGTVKRSAFDFSFSGLKTAILYHLRDNNLAPPFPPGATADIASSFQEAVVDALLEKLMRLAAERGARSLALGGGVAANARLRDMAREKAGEAGLPLYLSPREFTTDNAVMIAGLGYHLLVDQGPAGLDLEAYPH